MSVTTCREKACGARFLWGKTTKGRSIPLDAEQDATGAWKPALSPDGNVEDTGRTAWGRDGVRVPVVRVLTAAETAAQSLTGRMVSHFSTCPAASSFSKKPRRART